MDVGVQRLLNANRAANNTKIMPVLRSNHWMTYSRRKSRTRGNVFKVRSIGR